MAKENPYLEELEELQAAWAVASSMKKMLKTVSADYAKTMTLINSHIAILGKRIAEIKNGAEVIITDHAVVRYLQRYGGMDIDLIKEKISALPDAEKIVIAGNIITVGEDVNKPKLEEVKR